MASLESLAKIKTALYPEAVNLAVTGLDGALIPVKTDSDANEMGSILLGEWLRFYGPKSREFIATTLGLNNQWLKLSTHSSDLRKSGQQHLNPL